jgi:ribonuclease HI
MASDGAPAEAGGAGGAATPAERLLSAAPGRVVEVWTDGGCSPNPGPGGWAAILVYGTHHKELSGAEPHSTNNRMELTAAIAALEALKRPCRVVLHTDSEYLRNGITRWIKDWVRKGWRTAARQPVANQELWQRLLAAAEPHEIDWRWVRGHAGDPMNERVDRLAAAARESLSAGRRAGRR